MGFFAGIVKDAEAFLASIEHVLVVDMAPVVAKIRVALSDALGNFEAATYTLVKIEIQKAAAAATASGVSGIENVALAAYKQIKADLPGMGVTLEDTALHLLVAAVVANL